MIYPGSSQVDMEVPALLPFHFSLASSIEINQKKKRKNKNSIDFPSISRNELKRRG